MGNIRSGVTWEAFEVGENVINDTQYQESRLIKEINDIKLPEQRTQFRMLLVGPVHAGKSAFINSVACIDKNRMADVTLSGTSTAGSMTEKFQSRPIDENDPYYIQNPSLRWEAHCCVIVLTAEQMLNGSVPQTIIERIHNVQGYVKALNARRVVILTKTDHLCSDIQRVKTNRKVQKAVYKAVKTFKVPEMNVFPVVNYSSQTEPNLDMNILILRALRRMVQCACDQIEGNLANESRLVRLKEEENKDNTEVKILYKRIS